MKVLWNTSLAIDLPRSWILDPFGGYGSYLAHAPVPHEGHLESDGIRHSGMLLPRYHMGLFINIFQHLNLTWDIVEWMEGCTGGLK